MLTVDGLAVGITWVLTIMAGSGLYLLITSKESETKRVAAMLLILGMGCKIYFLLPLWIQCWIAFRQLLPG